MYSSWVDRALHPILFFFNDTSTTEIYPLSLHDALPICQDLSKYDLHYSHYGWAYRTPEGPWRVAHKLNECGTAGGHVYRQGLGEFFLDDLWRYEAGVQVPTPAVQQALWTFLTQPQTVLRLQHEP